MGIGEHRDAHDLGIEGRHEHRSTQFGGPAGDRTGVVRSRR
jgi:hypothetical protein